MSRPPKPSAADAPGAPESGASSTRTQQQQQPPPPPGRPSAAGGGLPAAPGRRSLSGSGRRQPSAERIAPTGPIRAGRPPAATEEPPATAATAEGLAAGGGGDPSRYWRSKCDTQVFTAPFGLPCGDVAAGTVVEEAARYLDFFDDMWIAVSADDDSVVWLRRCGPGGLTQARPEHWERVIESGGPALSATERAAAQNDVEDIPPLNLEKTALNHPIELLHADLANIAGFWRGFDQKRAALAAAAAEPPGQPSSSGASDGFVDWNRRYQEAIEGDRKSVV